MIHISTKRDKGFRLVYKLSYLHEKNFLVYFDQKGGPLQKKNRNFLIVMIWQFIHQSKALVAFSRNVMFLNFFEFLSGQKNPKNSVKIPYSLENNASLIYFYARGINYFYGHFEGEIRGVLCHGIIIESIRNYLLNGIRIK